jgi:hypothetical protein
MFSSDQTRTRSRSAAYVLVLAGLSFVSCASQADFKVDLTTTQGACDAVDESLRLMGSDDPADRDAGAELAEKIWRDTETDAEVSNGIRADCPREVIDMLDEADVPFDLWRS